MSPDLFIGILGSAVAFLCVALYGAITTIRAREKSVALLIAAITAKDNTIGELRVKLGVAEAALASAASRQDAGGDAPAN